MPHKDINVRREYQKQYRDQHKAQHREYAAEWFRDNYRTDPEFRERQKKARKAQYEKHRESEAASKSAWWFANHEENKARNRAAKKRLYWANPEHYRTYCARQQAEWKKNNPDKWAAQLARNEAKRKSNVAYFRAYWRAYKKRHPWRRMVTAMFTRTNGIMRGHVLHSRKSILLGCTPMELRDHVEAQFEPWMNWSNYGKAKGCWSLDHKIPLAAWDLSKPEDQAAALHYSNLQPLAHDQNIRKSSFYNGKKRWHDKSK